MCVCVQGACHRLIPFWTEFRNKSAKYEHDGWVAVRGRGTVRVRVRVRGRVRVRVRIMVMIMVMLGFELCLW